MLQKNWAVIAVDNKGETEIITGKYENSDISGGGISEPSPFYEKKIDGKKEIHHKNYELTNSDKLYDIFNIKKTRIPARAHKYTKKHSYAHSNKEGGNETELNKDMKFYSAREKELNKDMKFYSAPNVDKKQAEKYIDDYINPLLEIKHIGYKNLDEPSQNFVENLYKTYKQIDTDIYKFKYYDIDIKNIVFSHSIYSPEYFPTIYKYWSKHERKIEENAARAYKIRNENIEYAKNGKIAQDVIITPAEEYARFIAYRDCRRKYYNLLEKYKISAPNSFERWYSFWRQVAIGGDPILPVAPENFDIKYFSDEFVGLFYELQYSHIDGAEAGEEVAATICAELYKFVGAYHRDIGENMKNNKFDLVFEENYYGVKLEYGPLKYYLSPTQYYLFQSRYRLTSRDFPARLFVMLTRYNAIGQNALRKLYAHSAIQFLEETYVDIEYFANPINNMSNQYTSLFVDVDRYFGVEGSAFTLTKYFGGSCIIPPMVPEIIIMSCIHALNVLKLNTDNFIVLALPIFDFEYESLKKIRNSGYLHKEYAIKCGTARAYDFAASGNSAKTEAQPDGYIGNDINDSIWMGMREQNIIDKTYTGDFSIFILMNEGGKNRNYLTDDYFEKFINLLAY